MLRHSVQIFLCKSRCQPKSSGSGAELVVFESGEILSEVVRMRFRRLIDYFLCGSKGKSVPG